MTMTAAGRTDDVNGVVRRPAGTRARDDLARPVPHGDFRPTLMNSGNWAR